MSAVPEQTSIAEALPAYELGEGLGEGAFGVVYAATHRRLGRRVAVKKLTLDRDDDEARERFLTEARVLAGMDHPHVVPIYDYVEQDGLCLLVMEHLPGGTLLAQMRSGGFDAPRACGFAVAAAAALHHAHEQGILHRDVKPENLMFSRDGLLKVTDFGVAKVLGGSSATRTGLVSGTPAYMAPEQARGELITAATDVYAVGTVLFELLAGRLPYDPVDSPVAALYQHVHEDPLALREVMPTVPEPVAAAVDRALARDSRERYATAAQFAGELARAASGSWGERWSDELVRVLRAPLPQSGSPARQAETVVGRAVGRSVVAASPAPGAEPATAPPPRGRRRAALVAGGLAAAAGVAVVLATSLGGKADPGSAGAASSTATIATPADVKVVRSWIDAFNSSDDANAATFFAPGALVSSVTGGKDDTILTGKTEAVAWSEAFGCGFRPGAVQRVTGHQVIVNATFINRKGSEACANSPDFGGKPAFKVTIKDAKIASWHWT